MVDKFEYIRELYKNAESVLRFSKMYDDVVIPSKRPDDAGYDIYARLETPALIIEPHETVKIPTGLRVWVPKGYYMQLFERGSTGTAGIGQRAGVIDSSFTGEIFVSITNHNPDRLVLLQPGLSVPPGLEDVWDNYKVFWTDKAITQGVLLQTEDFSVVEISNEDMDKRATERGAGSLGSSLK